MKEEFIGKIRLISKARIIYCTAAALYCRHPTLKRLRYNECVGPATSGRIMTTVTKNLLIFGVQCSPVDSNFTIRIQRPSGRRPLLPQLGRFHVLPLDVANQPGFDTSGLAEPRCCSCRHILPRSPTSQNEM